MRRALLLFALLAGCSSEPQPALAPSPSPDLHSRLLTLDTHLDTPMHFARAGWSFGDKHDPATDLVQVDMGRMEEGNLDGGFFAIYTAQGPLTARGYADALTFARKRSDEIDATIGRFPDRIEAATTAADVRRIDGAGKLVGLKSMENSYELGEDIGLLEDFHRRGVRLASPVHSSNNQFADSATDKPRWNGLSPLGRRWVAEMNRLGMVIDASHSSDAAFDQMVELSKTPLILSHSSPRAIFDHPRNLDDARIRKLASSGGAICVSTVYLSPMNLSPTRAELFDRLEHIGSLTPAEQADLTKRWRELDKSEQMWAAGFDDFMKALLHVIEVAGVDHVCFGADWDGGGGIRGIEDISALPKVTERLKAAGFSEDDIGKMWSGNVLRLMEAAEAAAGR